jgi:hypothetical protein
MQVRPKAPPGLPVLQDHPNRSDRSVPDPQADPIRAEWVAALLRDQSRPALVGD